jgi:hypothetical protein
MRVSFVSRFVAIALVFAWALAGSAQVNVTTYHNDNGRTGQNVQELILTTSNVNATNFGKLFTQALDDYSYGQPLYVSNVNIPNVGTHNVVYVATMNDSVYAFDADSNTGANAQPLWHVNFTDVSDGITAVPIADVHCEDTFSANVGIMSTPVIDASSGTIYVLARTKENGAYFQRLHALDLATGAEKFGGPVAIQATVNGKGAGSKNGMITFSALLESQRSALLLQNGQVYISWASLCDYGLYHGWMMAYNASTLAQTAVWLITPNGKQGGIWQSGNGPAGDASFNTFTPVGNGTFDANKAGLDYGQSVVKLGPPSGTTLPVVDYFTPFNATTLNTTDKDIGSSGLSLLPDQTGPFPHLLVQGDKVGDLYLVNRDNMGQFNATDNSQIVQFIPTAASHGMWSSPAWWNNFVYIGGSGSPVQGFSFDPSTGLLSTTPATKTAAGFGYPGTTVSISSNGTTNGIVWALNNGAYKTATGQGILLAYQATNLGKQLYSSRTKATRDNPGQPIKFQVPTVANGKVYVVTLKGLSAYGLLSGGGSH